MNRGLVAAALVAALAAGGGYWAGQHRPPGPAAAAGTPPDSGKTERRILYYRNPMGLPDTSPTPKKDSMGMDYIPVYDGEDEAPADTGRIAISPEKIQKLGVRTEAATLGTLERVIRAAGRIEPDERRIHVVSAKFEGYVERLHVNATGQPVRRNQPLFEVYSPELVSAQREYLIARQGSETLRAAGADVQGGMRQLAEASLARLRNWDIPEEQVQSLAKSGNAKRTLVFRSPADGIVTEKKAVQGMRFMPGEALYQITDLSAVWVIAEVFEQDIALVRPGAAVRIEINAYPGQGFTGKLAYVYPTVRSETRTVPVRIELANPGGLLKPGMFARLELPARTSGRVVTVPASAVIDSGARQVVLIRAAEGRFEPREVRLGSRSDERVEILEGVREGEQVVVAANFLIDAESNLKAVFSGLGKSPAAAGVAHQAEGIVEEVDPAAGTASISHGPVASLKWPAMTMEFIVANEAVMKQLKPGSAIRFEFVERAPGEWVVTSVAPAGGGARHAH